MFFIMPYEIQTVVKTESSLTGKSVRQIIIEKLRGDIVEKTFSPEIWHNLLKLDEIESLKRNWNGNKAKPLSKKLIKKTRFLIINLEKQPQVFPTANNSIQIEYDGDNNSYLEFQVTKENKISYYMIDKTGKESSGSIPVSSFELNKIVEVFYG